MKNKNVVLADCLQEELIDFKDGLEKSTGLNWIIESTVSNWGRASSIRNLQRYFRYFSVPFKTFIKRKNYNYIIGWQQFYALNFCFFCRLFHVKKTVKVFVTNFTYKQKSGVIGKIYYKYMKYIVSSRYVDSLIVLSRDYINVCKEALGVNEGVFRTICFGVPDFYNLYKNVLQEDYAIAIGRSNRDYDWLIKEWQTINMPLRIISDTYKYQGELPNNVSIIDNISGDDQYPQIMGSKLVIIPIKDEKVCSGDTVLLTSLSFKKPVIVTAPSTLAEMYIENNYNGYCVKKECGCLAQCIVKAVNNEAIVAENARKSFQENYSRYSMGDSLGKLLVEMANGDT